MNSQSLFDDLNFAGLQKNKKVPLADRIRPTVISEVVGYGDYANKIYMDNLQSMILWGPPGSGKTSLAKIIAKNSGLRYYEMSGVLCGTANFKEALDSINSQILFIIDEIHHLNKSQQDLFLPHIENGNLILIGTTTENPSFELRAALLSRCKVIEFKRLQVEDLLKILERAEEFVGKRLPISDKAREKLCLISDGDGRYLVNRAEELFALNVQHVLDENEMLDKLPKRAMLYDKSKEEHYNLISALHKSLRGSDVNAALYWFNRMLEGGENPLYIARRLVRFAVEDIGVSDPNAVCQAISAQQAYNFLGSPEGELALAQAVIYLATAPKSNTVYVAYNKSKAYAKEFGSIMPDKRILNAPNDTMKNLGYSEGYIYDHDSANAFSGTDFFPASLPRQDFYVPSERGFEKEIKKRVDWWDRRRKVTKK